MCQSKYIVGDSRKLDNIIADNQLRRPNTVITSPPYYDVLDYNGNPNQIGYGDNSYDNYIESVVNVLQNCFSFAEDNATLWLIMDTFRREGELKLLPFDIVNKLKSSNTTTWKLREVIIWDKEKNLPWGGKGYFKNEFEYILFLTKGEDFNFNVDSVREINDLKKWWKTYPERYNPDGKAPSNVWSFTTPIRGWGNGRQNHLCPFPFPLIEKILSISTVEDDVVFDPFTGSGSVLAMSEMMNRHSVGVDINKEYKDLFDKEVKEGAQKYWINKQLELSKNKIDLSNFSIINDKLRKLKLASALCNHINLINDHRFIYLTKFNTEDPKLLELFVMENGVSPRIDIVDQEIDKLVKQMKLTPKVISIKDIEFYDKFRGLQLYKYQFKKFYSYTSACKLDNLGPKEDRYNYLYSDISIKIPD